MRIEHLIPLALLLLSAAAEHSEGWQKRRSIHQGGPVVASDAAQGARLGCEDSGYCSLGKVKHWQGTSRSDRLHGPLRLSPVTQSSCRLTIRRMPACLHDHRWWTFTTPPC